MDVWKLAKDFRREIKLLCDNLPTDEKYRLADQLIRASRSITANLAERHGRYHFQENIQFCRQARGSLFECLDHLTVCLENGYIDDKMFVDLEISIYNILKKLNGYIKYLRDKKNEK
ncbi:four helix bundle protein [Flexistipes sp.]|uniref:four helix bundle protein n=1 Tax=Flexistipes sp. TaxID=3088135 RepID=UPI002E21C982|nr:four helix bundle protein [Flexistipes sp.]